MKDVDPQKAEEMEEFGKDFPSYFGTGESIFPKGPSKMKSLKGLDDYIEEVDLEERSGRSTQHGYVAKGLGNEPIEKQSDLSTIFKSQREQTEFLSRYKTVEETLEQEEFMDDEENLGEVNQAFDEMEQMPQSAESSIQLDEPPLVTDLIKEQLEIETVINPAYAGQVAQLVEQVIINKDKGTEALKDEEKVERIDHWKFPDVNLLDSMIQREIIQDLETPKQLEKVLLDFGVKAKVIRVTRGPVITRYELAPAPGVKISKIVNLSDDIALGLAARDVRIEAPIPGKAAIGIEVPNKQARAVPFREVLETASFKQYPSKLKVALGKDIADQPIIADLVKMPHLLVAGATGAGKSVCITTIINSILYNATPDEVKFLLVDPKMVELSQYNGIPHLLAPVVTDPKKAASALRWIVKEMENRYELFAAAGVRDIERYNQVKGETIRHTPALPLIVVIIDELADLMMVAPGEVEEAICRLAQMARAAGIHLVIATQRPSVDVITGVIKANIPSRISFAVSSQIDSRTILDATGAEKLLGRGDMLYSPLGVNKALRVQGCLVTDDEVQRVIRHWKGLGKPEYLDPERLFEETTSKSEDSHGPDDAVFIDAGQLFIRTGMASVSFLQRRLKLGYTRAARLMDMLEEQGVVGGYEGSKPRQVLLTLEEFNERFG
ncbi:Cell division protein FtsK [Desulfosporosinus sp. I2]|uniref:DNA translocase FtsK n=1 Tax=Desulfosporosinus sp. I2 TaxID=1617025 RepID=UPI00061F51D5|nr:Cell division protein FtsK [Desulfosporosinus sp. I2]